MNAYHFIEERDLVQHQIVAALAERRSSHPRVRFKGGTLLRACWADEYRFSEDLDFDWILSPETFGKENILAFFHGVEKSVLPRPSADRCSVGCRPRTVPAGRAVRPPTLDRICCIS